MDPRWVPGIKTVEVTACVYNWAILFTGNKYGDQSLQDGGGILNLLQ